MTETRATHEEISAIINNIEPALEGVNPGHIVIALLSYVILMMEPTITPDGLQEALRETSQFICLHLGARTDGDKILMN
jgi:hypothetical protein